MKKQENSRRKFLKAGAAIGASMITGGAYGQRQAGEESGSSAMAEEGYRILGSGEHALKVSPIGLGCMSMTSGSYNPPRSKEKMVPVIRGAVDLGALDISFTGDELKEFRAAFERIELIGVRQPDTVLTDR